MTTHLELLHWLVGQEISINVFGVDMTGTLTAVRDDGWITVDMEDGSRVGTYATTAFAQAAMDRDWPVR